MSLPIPFCEKHQEPKRHYHHSYKCRSCQNEYVRQSGVTARSVLRASRRRAEWIAANGPCRHCGSLSDLQVDHIDPSTKNPALRTPSNAVWRWGDAKRNEELAKCQVLCKPCHLKKTINEAGGPAKHGTYARFVGHKCRCAECKEASRQYRLKHYAANREHYKAKLRISYWKRKLKAQGSVTLPEDLLHLLSHSESERSVSYDR